MTLGKVYLVGAGPGDPGLMTVKAMDLVRRADVIVYDRLIPASVLQEARAEAELVDAGKLPLKHRLNQEDINTTLVDRALKGLMVVRLKGGDPFVFGRGGEEGIACHAAGIPFEVVPGVSSAIAVPAYAGVPVTHRQIASAFTVFTGHEDPSKNETSVDYAALARIAQIGTLVLLMGVGRLPQISEKLIEAGLPADTLALCVEWGTLPQQRVVQGTLATIAALTQEHNIQPPSITILGAVIGLREVLNWYEGQ